MEKCSPYLDLLYFWDNGLCQANAKVGDGVAGELTELITVKVGAVAR